MIRHGHTWRFIVFNTVFIANDTSLLSVFCFFTHKQKGIWGAIAATVGMVVPSIVIIYAISMFFNQFLEIGIIASAFRGIKVGVGVIIVNAGIKMMKDVPKNGLPRLILLGAFAAMLVINLFALDFSTLWLLVAAGIVGLSAYLVKGGEGK